MAKLRAQKYHTKQGDKVNCYNLSIPKKIVEMAGINPEQDLILRLLNGKIIVEISSKRKDTDSMEDIA